VYDCPGMTAICYILLEKLDDSASLNSRQYGLTVDMSCYVIAVIVVGCCCFVVSVVVILNTSFIKFNLK
jgi:hypothetical protein